MREFIDSIRRRDNLYLVGQGFDPQKRLLETPTVNSMEAKLASQILLALGQKLSV